MAELLAACQALRPHLSWPQSAGTSPVASWGSARTPRVAALIATAIIVAVLLGVFVAQVRLGGSGSATFRYQVRVRSGASGESVANAKVTLETVVGSPQNQYTDTGGVAVFPLATSLRGSPARVIIESQGYDRFVQNITIQEGGLIEEFQLKTTP
jgi:hypothetical protein